MNLNQLIQTCKQQGDFNAMLEFIPYAKFIGVEIEEDDQGWLFTLGTEPSNVGNPISPALHGGVVAGFMEVAAALAQMLSTTEPTLPKIIDFSIDYISAGKVEPTHARCSLVRQGKRIANVHVVAWQSHIEQPIATARAYFLLSEEA